MVQQTEVVLPLVRTELADKIHNIEKHPLGIGRQILFKTVPPKEDIETIANSFATSLSKVTGNLHKPYDDSRGSNTLYLIQEVIGDMSLIACPTRYWIFNAEVNMRETGEKFPAVTLLKGNKCKHPLTYLEDFVKEVRYIKK